MSFGGGQFGGNPYQQPNQYGGPPPVSPEVQSWFAAVDADRSGRISAEELQGALVNANGNRFSYEVCRLMIGMFDSQRTGTIDIYGFQQLYNYVNQWLATFRSFDSNNSGSIDKGELTQALQQMGYRFSPSFIDTLLIHYDPKQRANLTTDNFIISCIMIQRITDAFRVRDNEMKGIISINYEDFLQVIFSTLP